MEENGLSTEGVLNLLHQEFSGIDQLQLVNARMDQMSHEELKGFTLVVLHHFAQERGECDNPVSFVLTFSRTIQWCLNAYDSAKTPHNFV
jgi:hypothetical protein